MLTLRESWVNIPEIFLFSQFCQHCLNAAWIFYTLHLVNVQYLLSSYCCNLCSNHNACSDLTTLIPPAIGSEVGVSLLAGTFYLIKVQPKWNVRNTMIWSQSGLCCYISDVLWLCLRGEKLSRDHHECRQVMVNQQSQKLQQSTPYWQHIANIVNSKT